MVTVIKPSHASQNTLKPLSVISSSSHHLAIPANISASRYHYKIQYVYDGETTLLLFAIHESTRERVAIKILKEYNDTRYHMATVEERQQCQVEALKQNQRFTPDVYIGLAQLYRFDLQKKEVYLSDIIKEPDNKKLESNAEYVLIMRWLPRNERLDCLLNASQPSDIKQCLKLLSSVIAKIHNTDLQNNELSLTEPRWGNYIQLTEKLDHNFEFFERVLKEAKKTSEETYQEVKTTLSQIQTTLSDVFTQTQFEDYFEQRVREGRILHCHGDLKAANIWILSSEHQRTKKKNERVKILDAIDFNPTYCNVDILSDMAMLAVDIEARTSPHMAEIFIRNYLRATKQNNKAAKAVLAYYLAERAMIGAIVYIGYDALPDIGLKYLHVAERYIFELQFYNRVKRHTHTSEHKSKGIALRIISFVLILVLSIFAFHRSSSNHSE